MNTSCIHSLSYLYLYRLYFTYTLLYQYKVIYLFIAFFRFDPVSMSFNVYDKSRNDENIIPLIIMHGLFGSKSNWNSLSKAINEITCSKVCKLFFFRSVVSKILCLFKH